MHVFVTGATGWIGSAVTDELLAHGHRVTGLARSDAKAAALEAKGATVRRGSLADLDGLAEAAGTADAVIHLAFNHDFSDFAGAGRTERAAVERMLTALEGTGRPFLFASGLAGAKSGEPLTEADPSPHQGVESARGGSESLALSYADRGVRPIALRFPIVHGMADPGFVAVLTEIAARRGVSGYIGDGSTHWAAVHRGDAARVVRLALDRAPAGFRVHALAEGGIRSRDIAAAIGERLGVPTASIPASESAAHFGWLGAFFGTDVVATNERTRQLLDWTPTGPTLLADIAAGAYPGPTGG